MLNGRSGMSYPYLQVDSACRGARWAVDNVDVGEKNKEFQILLDVLKLYMKMVN